jgi:hypothetical protein
MRCRDCEFFAKRTLTDGSQEMVCGLTMQRRDLVDGCENGQVKVEEYEDRALYGFDDDKRY